MATVHIQDKTATTTPLLTDILPIVVDPGGTPLLKKVTVSNLLGVYKSRIILSGDIAINSGAADTLQDMTGLLFAVVNGSTYWFRMCGWFSSTGTGCGSRWTINGPAMTMLAYQSEYGLTATTSTRNGMLTAIQLPAAANATSSVSNGAGNIVLIEGICKPSADGSIQVQGAREVTTQTITLKAGTYLEYKLIL